MNLSKMGSNENFKLFPKAENSFMKDHQLAIEKDFDIYIYITPELKEKTLKAKGKKELKKVCIETFKERWDATLGMIYGPY